MQKNTQDKATEFCKRAHNSIKQTRKYTGEPYWVHPLNVAEILRVNGEDSDDVIVAALLHDVIEDVYSAHVQNGNGKSQDYSYKAIRNQFGINVANIVFDLTDVYTHNAYPYLNREKRKELEAKRLSNVSDEAKIIKFADCMDNYDTIRVYDKDFAKVYCKEMVSLFTALRSSANNPLLVFDWGRLAVSYLLDGLKITNNK